MYERLIKEIKKTVYKTLGKTHLTFELHEAVVIDIEKHLKNRPLTYAESYEGWPQIQNAQGLKDIEINKEEVAKC